MGIHLVRYTTGSCMSRVSALASAALYSGNSLTSPSNLSDYQWPKADLDLQLKKVTIMLFSAVQWRYQLSGTNSD